MDLRAGDRIIFTKVDPDEYYSITKGKAYDIYEDSDGWMCISDDDGDEAYITNGVGEERAWVERTEYHVVGENSGVMIDAEELLGQIDGGTRYNMTVEEVVAYLRGFIHANKGGK